MSSKELIEKESKDLDAGEKDDKKSINIPLVTIVEQRKKDEKLKPMFNETIKKINFISEDDLEVFNMLPLSYAAKINILHTHMKKKS